MRKDLDAKTAGIVIGAAVVVIGLVFYLLFNPLRSIPPAPGKPGRTVAMPLPSGPPPADQIRHGPIGP